jgi:hypothetical protein
MFNIAINRPTHGARLERWLGKDQVAQMSSAMGSWYGPPIAVAGVPGNVWALPGGDFGGIIKSGQFINAVDFGLMRLKARLQRFGLRSRQQCNTGFSSLSDLIAEATAGKRTEISWNKAGSAAAATGACSLWGLPSSPGAGSAGSAAPAGRACDATTAGAITGITNVSPDTRHFVFGMNQSTVAATTLLLYDRIFDVAKTMNSTATEAVTGVPTRYQSNTSTDQDYAGGNFCTVETQATLANTAHNWDSCLYRNQAGTDNQIFPSIAGINANSANRIDLALGNWFMPLAAGDYGVADLAQMQCSALVASGDINFVIGHPLAFLPCPLANVGCSVDGINTAFNLVRIFDGACLALMDVQKPNTTSTTHSGTATFVYG